MPTTYRTPTAQITLPAAHARPGASVVRVEFAPRTPAEIRAALGALEGAQLMGGNLAGPRPRGEALLYGFAGVHPEDIARRVAAALA